MYILKLCGKENILRYPVVLSHSHVWISIFQNKVFIGDFDILISKRKPTSKSSVVFFLNNYTSKALEMTLAVQRGTLYPKYVDLH